MIAPVKVDESPVALYVKKFRLLCDMHSVRFGSADSFSRFMRQLVDDRKFAMDFWALAGGFSSREGGPLSDEQMLDVIGQEIAGCAVSTADGSLKQQVDDLRRMLAGEDVSSPIVRDDEIGDIVAPPAPVIPPQVKAISTPPIRPSEVPPPPLPSQPTDEPHVEASPLTQPDEKVRDRMASELVDPASPPEPALTQHQLDEALLRLELNSLELKLHLDNIDSRMSRMEPHLEELASKVFAARASVRGIAAEPIVKPEQVHEPLREHVRPMQESVGRAVERSRIVLEQQPVAAEVRNLAEDDDDPSIPIPLAGYAQRRFSRSAGLFAALLLVGVGGFIFVHWHYGASIWADFGPSLRERYDAARNELRGVGRGRAADGSDRAGSGEAKASDRGQSQVAPVASETGSAVAGQNTNVATEAVAESHVADSRTDVGLKRKSHAVTPAVDRDEVASSKSVSAGGGLEAPVRVAPSVMEENLVVSRVPAYPEVARADRVEGPVVMQAIITKNGTVGHLHVIEGDKLLRSAASEAVSKWRYRPYTVDGKPVEVATTVTVDFKLNR